MKRFAFASSVTLLLTLAAATAFAQGKAAQPPATKAAPTASPAPAAPAKFVRTLKGTADIQFIQLPSKKVGGDIVTVLKVKNLSPLAVSLLKVDEYWYDKTRQVVTGDSQPWRKPFMPGEIIEVTMRSPFKPNLTMSQYQFSHAGGKVNLKRVTKFE
jgi:hypothetical protein